MEHTSPLDIVNEEEEHKVKKIRNHKKWGSSTQFLVHWKEYNNEHDQWISKTGFPHTKGTIEDHWLRILDQNL